MGMVGEVGSGVEEVEGAIKSKILINSLDPVESFAASQTAAEGGSRRIEPSASALALALS